MELTKEQIQTIENYLQKKRLDYVDLKHEVLDHIIMDIEEKIKKEKVDFKSAFEQISLKWNMHFKDTSSFYFGIMYSDTKLVIKKAVQSFKPYFFIYLAFYSLPVLFSRILKVEVSESLADFINGFVLSSSLVACFYILLIAFKVSKSKVKTTYSFILKTQYWSSLILLINALTGVFEKDNVLNPFYMGLVLSGYSAAFICYHFYKKHKEVIAKFKIA